VSRRQVQDDPAAVGADRYSEVAQMGEAETARHIATLALGLPERNAHLVLSLGFGALVAATRFLKALAPDHSHVRLKRWVDGYVRGVFAGAGGPIHEDGRPMERSTDA
jgi:hypothetical protein